MRFALRRWGLAALLLVAACAPGAPAPVEYRSGAPYRPASPPPPRAPAAVPAAIPVVEPEPAGGEIVVRPGDTLFGVSERHQVPLRALIEENGLEPPFALTAGERLKLPPPNTYTVQAGDTLYGVARRHRVDFRSLAVMNAIKEPYAIRPGQSIRLPALARDWMAASAGEGGIIGATTVAAGDGGAVTTGAMAEGPRTLATVSRPEPSGPPPRFLWPIDGTILSAFGPKGLGRRNDGVNIAALEGAPVKAAADGVVVYADDKLAGYGKLVLVKHPDGWISAYAHNRTILVKEDQTVAQGETIAQAGATGSVETAQVHFELRRAGQPVDPATVLPRKSG